MPDSEAPGLRLIAGLGNPGREYEGTRHNAGFAVLDELASRLGTSFSKEAKWDAHVAKVPGSDLVLLKPATFMNLSGEAVAGYARFYRILHGSVLVVADDVALPREPSVFAAKGARVARRESNRSSFTLPPSRCHASASVSVEPPRAPIWQAMCFLASIPRKSP